MNNITVLVVASLIIVLSQEVCSNLFALEEIAVCRNTDIDAI